MAAIHTDTSSYPIVRSPPPEINEIEPRCHKIKQWNNLRLVDGTSWNGHSLESGGHSDKCCSFHEFFMLPLAFPKTGVSQDCNNGIQGFLRTRWL